MAVSIPKTYNFNGGFVEFFSKNGDVWYRIKLWLNSDYTEVDSGIFNGDYVKLNLIIGSILEKFSKVN